MSKTSEQLQAKKQELSNAFNKLPAVITFQQWFTAQSTRDQGIIKAVSLFVIACLIIVIFIQPFYSKQSSYQAKLDKSIKTYEQLASNAHKFAGKRSSSSNKPILALITQQAKISNINLKRFEPDNENLRIWLDDVPFDDAVRWLETLTQNHGIRVKQISIDRSEKRGRIDLRATLYK